MPIYEYKCACGTGFEKFLPVKEYNDPQSCRCGKTATRQISRPMSIKIQPDLCYQSPIDGRVITTHQGRTNDLERSNCIPYEKGMREDAQINARKMDEAIEKSVDETVEATIENMPAVKRELLQNELAHSSIEYTRG